MAGSSKREVSFNSTERWQYRAVVALAAAMGAGSFYARDSAWATEWGKAVPQPPVPLVQHVGAIVAMPGAGSAEVLVQDAGKVLCMHTLSLLSVAATGVDLGIINYAAVYAPCLVAVETAVRIPAVQSATGLAYPKPQTSLGGDAVMVAVHDLFTFGCLWCHLQLGLYLASAAVDFVSGSRGSNVVDGLGHVVGAAMLLGTVAAHMADCYAYGAYAADLINGGVMATNEDVDPAITMHRDQNANTLRIVSSVGTVIAILIITVTYTHPDWVGQSSAAGTPGASPHPTKTPSVEVGDASPVKAAGEALSCKAGARKGPRRIGKASFKAKGPQRVNSIKKIASEPSRSSSPVEGSAHSQVQVTHRTASFKGARSTSPAKRTASLEVPGGRKGLVRSVSGYGLNKNPGDPTSMGNGEDNVSVGGASIRTVQL